MSITVFQILEKYDIGDLEKKLKKIGKKIEKKMNPTTGEYEDLIVSIDNVKNNVKRIQGIMKCDFLDSFEGRNGINYFIKTKSVDFTFMRGSGWFLLIHANVKDAKIIEQYFDRIVFLTYPPELLPCDITPPVMSKFLEDNNCYVYRCSWDGIDIPQINGINLKGTGINDTDDFKHYDNHGQKKNVMFNYPEENFTLSINRKAGVNFFTKLTREQQETFMKNEILPLCR